MTLLPVLMLAAGLNTAATPIPPASAARAETTLNRLVNATAPALERRSLNQALTESTNAFNRSANLAPRLATSTDQAETRMNRLVDNHQAKLAARAIDEALAASLHSYKESLASEIARAGTVYGIADRAAAKSVAKTAHLSLQ
ncbi:MAG: hypothetical protein ACRER1_01330 [Gammaproteobacteria bacterium]